MTPYGDFKTGFHYLQATGMEELGTRGTEVEILALVNFLSAPIYLHKDGKWHVYWSRRMKPFHRRGERDNAEQDAESYSPSTPWVDEDQSDREARSGRLGERREISTNRTPSLTPLGEEDTDIEIHWVHILHSWKKFLEWLGDRWWGDAPFDKITRALNQPTAQNAMIFSEPREPSRLGALCSIAWKGEKDKLRSHAIVLNRGMYTCTDLRGYFDSPTNIAVDLSRLRGLEILSKPRHLMSHKKSYFYDSRIPTQLRNITL
ncbi:hypothetical protein Q5P01_000925, partial [Channa striata]